MATTACVTRSAKAREPAGDAHMLNAVDPHGAAWACGKVECGGAQRR